MSKINYSKEFNANVGPHLVFKALTSEIDKWWTIHCNKAVSLNDNLTVRFGETTVKEMIITELNENKSLTWEVTKAYIDIKELSKKDEWVGTKIKWAISPTESGSKVCFTHEGLTPLFECYEACEGGWNYFLDSLKSFLNTGKGTPQGVD